MTTTVNVQPPTRHPALQAWSDARGTSSKPARVESLKRTRKTEVYRIQGVGPEGGNVIAKRGRALLVERERRVYEHVLSRLPALGVSYFGTFVDRGGRFAWLFTEEAAGEAYSPSLSEHRASAARWLAQLHRSTCALSQVDWLPDRGPAHYWRRLNALRSAIGFRLSQPVWNADERRALDQVSLACAAVDRTWSRVEAACAGVRASLVHGDFKQKNLRVRPGQGGPELEAFDWSNCGWGVAAVDLAQSSYADRPLGANPDLDVYQSEAAPGQPRLTSSKVEALALAGRVFRCLDMIGWEMVWMSAARMARSAGEGGSWHQRPLANLHTCADEMRWASADL